MSLSAYLDNHTAARPLPLAIEEMARLYRDHWGALSAPHQIGQAAFPPYRAALERICNELGAAAGTSFYLYSSGVEAVQALFLSHYTDTIRETGKNHIVTSNTEELSTHLSLQQLEKLGCVEKVLPVNAQGQITQAMLEEVLGPRTGLVSLSWANGLTGVIHPIADLGELCRKKGVRFHVDASYVIGKLFFRFEDLAVDFLTFDGRQLHSPQGTGGLLTKSSFPPPIEGHEHVPAMGALAVALREMGRHFDHLNLETVRLRDKFEQGILAGYPGAVVFFQNAERLPNCCAIGFPGVAAEPLLYLLHRKGVCATLGGGRFQQLSDLLIAVGVSPELAQSALSFSLSFETTEEEIDYALQTILTCATELRSYASSILEEHR